MKLPILLLVLLPCAALAQAPGDPVKALAAEAAEHFEAGRYCHAVQAYREAYKLEPLAELLYNIAYIHDRKLNDPEVARVYYQRFVRARDSNDKTRLKAYERLDTLRSMQPAALAAAPTTLSRRADRLPMVDDGGSASGTRSAAWIALGVGAAALITGATFAALATHSHSQFEDADDAATRQKLADEGEARALYGDIGLGIGLAGLATGGVLYLLSRDDDGPTMGAAPTDGGMTFGVSGSF